jgi:hypothetical protein
MQIQGKMQTTKNLPKIWDQKFGKTNCYSHEQKIKSNFDNFNLKYINNFNIKVIWKHLNSIFEIIINLTDFLGRFKINTNDITKVFFVVNFHDFANIKRAININKGLFNF